MFASLFSLSSVALASELALYWGQNSAGTETSLANYCQNSPGDIYIISFINSFGSGRQMAMNIHGYYNFLPGTQLLDAPTLGQDIQTCQSLGKKVLISLGGSVGDYGFSSDADAEQVATDLWNYFGGGTSNLRPFGAGVKLDGFDLDTENHVSTAQYATLANKLSSLYATDPSKKYYTSAAPQCPFPDASVGDAIANSHIDYLFVQFYNNYCSLTGSNFNFNTWQNFASTQSPNKDVKILVGVAGSPTAAGSGYATIDQIKAQFAALTASPNFGGFSVWDASQANTNSVGGVSFAQQLENLLKTDATTPATSSSIPASLPTNPAVPASSSIATAADSSDVPASAVPAVPATIASPSNSSISYTTVIGTYTTVIPCTTSTNNNGVPSEAVGVTTVVATYTSTVPCDTSAAPNVVTTVAPTAAAVSVSAAPVTPEIVTSKVAPNATWFGPNYALVSASAAPLTTNNAQLTTTIIQTSTVTVQTTRFIVSNRPTTTISVLTTSTSSVTVTDTPTQAPTGVPVTTINGEIMYLATVTRTHTVNQCSC